MSVTAIAPNAGDTAAEGGKKKGGKKKIIIIALLVAVLGGAGWFFFLKPSGPPPPPEPGEVLALEPIQINLESGHYLRLGMALQFSAEVHGGADGSKALDRAIDLFSGLPMSEVNNGKHRAELKKELMHHLEEDYHHDVLDVFFTEYVTQ